MSGHIKPAYVTDVNKDLGIKAKAKDLDFGLKDQGQGLTSLAYVAATNFDEALRHQCCHLEVTTPCGREIQGLLSNSESYLAQCLRHSFLISFSVGHDASMTESVCWLASSVYQ